MIRPSASALRLYVCREPLRLLLGSAVPPPASGRPFVGGSPALSRSSRSGSRPTYRRSALDDDLVMALLLKSCFRSIESMGEAIKIVLHHVAIRHSRRQPEQHRESCSRGGRTVRHWSRSRTAEDGRRHRLNGIGDANYYLWARAKWCARDVGLTMYVTVFGGAPAVLRAPM